jgi:hypothetical protein
MKTIRNNRELELSIRELELRASQLSIDMDRGLKALKEDFMTLKQLGEMAKEGMSGKDGDHDKIMEIVLMAGKLLI